MSYMHGDNSNGCQGLLEESVDRHLMYTGFGEILEFREDLIQIGSQLYFQTGTLLNGLLSEPVKFFEFDVVKSL